MNKKAKLLPAKREAKTCPVCGKIQGSPMEKLVSALEKKIWERIKNDADKIICEELSKIDALLKKHENDENPEIVARLISARAEMRASVLSKFVAANIARGK